MIINGPVVLGFLAAIVLAGVLVAVEVTQPLEWWHERKRERAAAKRRHPAGSLVGTERDPFGDPYGVHGAPRPSWADVRRDVDAFGARNERFYDTLHDRPVRVESRRIG